MCIWFQLWLWRETTWGTALKLVSLYICFLCEVGYNFGLRVGERLFMRDCFEVVFIVFVFAVQLVLTLARKLERDYTWGTALKSFSLCVFLCAVVVLNLTWEWRETIHEGLLWNCSHCIIVCLLCLFQLWFEGWKETMHEGLLWSYSNCAHVCHFDFNLTALAIWLRITTQH
jgi:hypothetical protein